jgi:hypothetical protein
MSTMAYRRLSPSGDYTFGQGQGNFLFNNDACGQAVYTGLLLQKGSFWRNLNAGLPLYQQILATLGSPGNQAVVDGLVKTQILSTPNVVTIVQYSSSINPINRKYSFSCIVSTIFGNQTFTGTL